MKKAIILFFAAALGLTGPSFAAEPGSVSVSVDLSRGGKPLFSGRTAAAYGETVPFSTTQTISYVSGVTVTFSNPSSSTDVRSAILADAGSFDVVAETNASSVEKSSSVSASAFVSELVTTESFPDILPEAEASAETPRQKIDTALSVSSVELGTKVSVTPVKRDGEKITFDVTMDDKELLKMPVFRVGDAEIQLPSWSSLSTTNTVVVTEGAPMTISLGEGRSMLVMSLSASAE